MYSLKAAAPTPTEGIKSTTELFVQYSQRLHPLTHHVLTEGSSVGINKRNQVFHGFVQGWDQASHLGVQVIELTVAIRHKTNHGTQGCTLQKNTATTHTHTCTHTHTHAYTHTTSSGTCHNQNLYISFEPCSLLTPPVSSCDILTYCLTLSLQNIFWGVTAVEITGSLFGIFAWSPQCLFIQKNIQFYSYPSSSTLTRLCSCITLVIWREKGHNSQTISLAPLNKTVSCQKIVKHSNSIWQETKLLLFF